MHKFTSWLKKENTSNVVVDNRSMLAAFKKQAETHVDAAHDRIHLAKNFNPQKFFQNINTQLADYPQLKNLLQALNSKNVHYIFDQQKRLRDWFGQMPYQKTVPLRDISRQIYSYVDTFDDLDENPEKGVEELVKQAVDATNKLMEELKDTIEGAIARIPHWNGSPVIISPSASSNEYGGIDISPVSSAEITLGTQQLAPQFMIFNNDGKLEIDDVLEGGDTDFFQNPQIQADYFNLINELRKPGSTGKGKIMSLYTARPVQDRQKFIDEKTLPINVFLANNYDHVFGLASDLSSNEPRDIWKVKIDSKYLTQTLEGKIKYYQITVPNAPVLYLDLITQGGK